MTDSERQPLLQPGNDSLEEPISSTEHRAETLGSETDLNASESKISLTIKLLAVMINFFTTGLGQSAVGALIPDIEAYYHLKNGPTAFIFPAAIVGYFIAVYLMERLHLTFGRRGLGIVAPFFRILSCILLSLGLPFPVALLGYLIFGFGAGFTDAGFCAWGSGVPFANVVQGFMHGTWSIGCVVGPLVAVRVVGSGRPWYSFYVLVAMCCVVEWVALVFAFRHETAARYIEHKSPSSSKYNPLKSKITWLCALYWVAYTGVESSYGDWIVTYMDRVRHVERRTAASAASIFWSGMCFGRIALSPITEYVGTQSAVLAYIVLAFVAQGSLRLVESTSAFMILLAVIGAFFGPIFPSGVVLLGKKLQPEYHVRTVSTAAALGQTGGSIAPLLVGFLADAFGIGRLLDVVTVFTVLLIGLWIIFCRAAA